MWCSMHLGISAGSCDHSFNTNCGSRPRLVLPSTAPTFWTHSKRNRVKNPSEFHCPSISPDNIKVSTSLGFGSLLALFMFAGTALDAFRLPVSREPMENNVAMRIVDFVAQGLELVGVAVIGASFLYAAFRAIGHFRRGALDAYDQLKVSIGRALQLGLEFLVAADIISTVTVEPTRERIVSLGLLILIRTFLSWSIAVEIEGCWPWQMASKGKG